MAGEWQEVALEKVADEITVGYVGTMASEYVETGIPFLRSLNIEPFRVNDQDIRYITPEFHAQLRKSSLRPGDVVIVRTGKPGATAVVPDWLEEANCSDLVIVRVGKNLDSRYLAYYVNGLAQHHIRAHLVGAVQQHFNVASARSLKLLLPSLSEQQAIVAVLGSLDDKIELNRRMNQTLEEIAQAIFKSWFVDFVPVRTKAAGEQPSGLAPHIADLFPDEFEESEMGEIPTGWDVASVDSLANINQQSLGKTDSLDVIDYIEINKVSRGDISEIIRYERGSEPSRARRRLRHGDTVLSTVRPDRGAHFLCLNPAETLIASTGFAVLSPKDGSWAFLYSALTLPQVGETLARLADGAAYPAVRSSVVGNLAVVTPENQQLLHVFERIAEPLYEKADGNRNQSLTLAALRDTLLPKLISGELRVPDAERIVERCV